MIESPPIRSGPSQAAGLAGRAGTFEKYIVASAILELLADLCLLVWLLSGPSIALRDRLAAVSGRSVAVVALYAVIVLSVSQIVTFPISVFRGFLLPKRMGLSRDSLGSWARDLAKGWVLGLAIGTALIELLYALLRSFPRSWWILAAIGIVGLMILFTILTPIVLVPLFFRTTPLKKKALKARAVALARKAGIRIRGIYEFNLGRKTRAANAALTGMGGTRRILLSDTLLGSFTADEIEGVLAHEMGHHVHHHLWKGILLNGALTFVSLLIMDAGLAHFLPRFHFRAPDDVANFPLVALIFGTVGMFTIPLAAAASRAMERAADRYAIGLTRRPSAFVATLKKLGRLNLSNPSPHPLVEFFFYTHPPIRKRIALIRSLPRSPAPTRI